MLANTQYLIKNRYWPVSRVHLLYERHSSVTATSKSFNDYYGNHKKHCLTGQIIPVWRDFTEQL